MKKKFKNGSTIEDLKNKGTNRGILSNFMTMPCLDLETGETEIVCLDMREQFERYVPMFIVDKINEEREEMMVFSSNQKYNKNVLNFKCVRTHPHPIQLLEKNYKIKFKWYQKLQIYVTIWRLNR